MTRREAGAREIAVAAPAKISHGFLFSQAALLRGLREARFGFLGSSEKRPDCDDFAESRAFLACCLQESNDAFAIAQNWPKSVADGLERRE